MSATISPNTYTIPQVLTGLREEDVRRKGEQLGTLRYRGGAWYISFYCWQPDAAGNLIWDRVERKIEGNFPHTERGRMKAHEAGKEQWVYKANAQCKMPAGLAALRDFYETRFVPDHVDTLKKGGRIHYRTIWTNHIKPTLGGIQLREISPQMIQQLISAKLAAGLSTQTAAHIRNALSAIFRHARNLRFLDGQLPTEGVRLPEMVRSERKALTWEQVQILTAAMPARYRPLVIVLAQTGLRIGEAAGLLWKHVNLGDDWRIEEGEALPPNSLLVCSNWTRGERTSTKNRSWRKIPLAAESWVALMQEYEMSKFQGAEQPVFSSRNGTPLDAHNVSNRALKVAAKKIGMPWVSFHVLRHSAATMADRAGLTIAEKQKILGHRTADLSTHYTHPEIERVRQAMEQMTTGRVQ